MNNLSDQILANLNDSTQQIWFPELTPLLVSHKWESLKARGITPSTYTSEAALGTASISSYFLKEKVTGLPIFDVSNQLLQDGLRARSYTLEELESLEVLTCLAEAMGILSQIPSVISTIRLLVNNLHLIRAEEDGYDISYSLPDLPFSIFVSVPSIRAKHDAIRVAEAILHEAMHLQLTLIDEIVPLINSTTESSFFSPWKNEYRHPLGVLHALYVFKNIRDFLEVADMNDLNWAYCNDRITEIDLQIDSTSDFADYKGLTPAGKTLTRKLYKKSMGIEIQEDGHRV